MTGAQRAAESEGTSCPNAASSPIFTVRLENFAPELSRVGEVPTDLSCECCEGPVHEILVVPGAQIGRPGCPVRVLRCLNCSFEDPVYVFFENGEPVRVQYEEAQDQDFLEGDREQYPPASIRWTPGPPAGEPAEWGRQTLAGGSPAWLQNPAWPNCPSCETEMAFVLQLSSTTLDAQRLQIELEQEFYLSIEYYATLYCFECAACEVTGSVTQCT